MADVICNSFKRDIANGGVDLDIVTIKVALVTSSYDPDAVNHDSFIDITIWIADTSYTPGTMPQEGVSVGWRQFPGPAAVAAGCLADDDGFGAAGADEGAAGVAMGGGFFLQDLAGAGASASWRSA